MRVKRVSRVLAAGAALVLALAAPARALASGAGGRILFVNETEAGPTELWVMNADGSSPVKLTDNSATLASDREPVWSPDGTKVTFRRYQVVGPSQIWVMNADGSNQVNLTNDAFDYADPVWSPDGTKIAFTSTQGAGWEHIWTLSSDGSGGLTQLTSGFTIDLHPTWSPDGKHIAFMSLRGAASYQIYVMDADGSNQTNVSNNAYDEQNPAWSPDGTKIAYVSYGAIPGFLIYTMNADGSSQTDVNAPGYDPAWSPDSKEIAFTRGDPDTFILQVWTMNADGTNQTDVSSLSLEAFEPDWAACPPGVQLHVAPDAANATALLVDGTDGDVDLVTLEADVTETNPGDVPDLCAVTGMTITLTPVLGAATLSQPASLVSCAGGVLKLGATFANVPVNVYDVRFAFDPCLPVSGSAETVLGVFDPALGFVTGGGTVDRSGVSVNFGFSGKYLKKRTQGSLLYVEHRPTGDVTFKGNQISLVSIVGNQAVLTGKGILDGVGNYSFRATVTDGGKGGKTDAFGLQVWNPNGTPVAGLTFAPAPLTGGNITVPHK